LRRVRTFLIIFGSQTPAPSTFPRLCSEMCSEPCSGSKFLLAEHARLLPSRSLNQPLFIKNMHLKSTYFFTHQKSKSRLQTIFWLLIQNRFRPYYPNCPSMPPMNYSIITWAMTFKFCWSVTWVFYVPITIATFIAFSISVREICVIWL